MVDEPPRDKYNKFPGDKYLIASESHRFYGLSRKLSEAIDVNAGKTFIIQYEFRSMEVWDCAGGYLKFFSDPAFEPAKFSGADHYNLMFGPDRCGGTAKVHFIIQRPDPKTGALVEHHLVDPPEPKLDYNTHFYQLVIDTEKQTFDIFIDTVNSRNGSLLTEFSPPLQPLADMDDASDRQPDSWVTQEQIPDPAAVKPADWDETAPEFIDDAQAQKPEEWDETAPEYVADPNAVRPADWSDEEDGPWMHPMIPNPLCSTSGCGKWLRPRVRNPAYKGKWARPLVANPAYKGKWTPRRIPNPVFYEYPRPSIALKPITAIGVEWWTVQKNAAIDNIVIGRSKKALDAFAEAASMAKVEGEQSMYHKMLSGGGGAPEQKPLQVWKFAVVGGFVASIVVLIIVLKCCCGATEAKPKRD